MNEVLVLMKAMPPTVGHRRLIEFAKQLGFVTVLIDTKRDEPMIDERVKAVGEMLGSGGIVHHVWIEIQDPQDDSFWNAWDDALEFCRGRMTYVVASEPYGAEVAKRVGARFLPYDPKRELCNTHAENIRLNPNFHWNEIDPSFQPYLRTTVTLWGAESTGKTTLSKMLASKNWGFDTNWLYEYARPYLETVGPEITIPKMEDIWHGQAAVQRQFHLLPSKSPVLIQDTDLFSTVGYWDQPHWAKELGTAPFALCEEAVELKSDLYIITPSNIPFEQDEIRYGDGVRESPDEYWINLAKRAGLHYVVLQSDDLSERLEEAKIHIGMTMLEKLDRIKYDRKGF